MKQEILARIGEIALKGLNRGVFERRLAINMRKAVSDLGECDINWAQSRFYVRPKNDSFNFTKALERLSGVFGLVSISPAYVCENEMSEFFRLSEVVAREVMAKKVVKTFKIETKRAMKTFPKSSQDISADIGEHILNTFPELTVDVHNPDMIIWVEVREKGYVYSDIITCPGGMPTGTNGKACLLLSGGIDSPVAGYMIGRRGVSICCVHFYSYPYTSERAKEKVLELAEIVSHYTGPMKVMVVPMTDIQLSIHQKCREELGTVLLRRSMMRIADRLARKNGCSALVTGESVGQVASQTVQAIYCTDAAATMPIYRPLIGNDKMEVVAIANKIGTFDTSILPYEDCCTVFTPKHPKTRPNLDECIEEEKNFDYKAMEDKAIEDVEVYQY